MERKVWQLKKLRRDDSGFSLVEVLMAMAILAVIGIPLMANFSTNAVVNRRIKAKQAATALAMSTMETVKNMNMENTAYNFNLNENFTIGKYTVTSSGEYSRNAAGNLIVLATSAAGNSMNDGLASAYSNTSASGAMVYNPKSDGEYYYVLNGVKDGINEYDVLLHFSAEAYNEYQDAAGNDMPGYNSQSLEAISGLDPKRSAIITSTTGLEDDAVSYFESMVADESITAAKIKKDMFCQMVVNISGTDDPSQPASKQKMDVEATVTYYYDDFSKEETVYSGSFAVRSDKHLEKLYLLFNESPGSKIRNGMNSCDEFEINNNGHFTTVHPRVYVIKQGSTGLSHFYNMTYNGDSGFFEGYYSNIPKDSLNRSPIANKFSHINKNDEYHVTDDFFSSASTSSSSADASENRIYNVTVSVYEHSDTDKFQKLLTSITSTRREK